jgi:sigma-B regulation protein RsbU (phosphoserine phosphatase)
MPGAEDQLTRYRVLMNTARCFWRTMDLQTLIDQILDRSQEVMRAEACTLFLPDHETGELILHSTDPKLALLPEPLRVPKGKGIAGAVFETRSPINIKDPATDARYYQGIAQKVGFTTRAMLTIPLLEGPNCMGVLQALNPVGRECFDEQDEEIFEGFGGLIAIALVRLEAERQQIEIARSKQELQVAREIQESFLPPAVEKFPFGRVLMDYFPASEVGGDFCSVHQAGEDKLLVGLGDVTGKGIPASLTMARATAMIKALVPLLKSDLGQWVSLLNDQLAQDLQGGRFIGMTFLLTDATSAILQICTAGQFAPVHFDGATWSEFSAESHLPLGIAPGIGYRATRTTLKPGHSWLLFSDGIPEARNRSGDDFSLATFVRTLNETRTNHSLHRFVARWKEFVGYAPQHDDASLLLLDWRGKPPPTSLDLVCCAETMSHGRDFIEGWATYAGFDDVAVGQIILACDEAATNVFRHAYGSHPGPLTFHAEIDEIHLTLRMTDKAKPVDPSTLTGRDLEDLRPGGLGTVIIQQVFDEVTYEPLALGTALTLRKKLLQPD